MKKKIVIGFVMISALFLLSFNAYSDCSGYFWGIFTDSGFQCPNRTRQTVTWRINWGDGSTNTDKSNYAYGACARVVGEDCAPVFDNPQFSEEIIGGRMHVIWSELSHDRTASGGNCYYSYHRTSREDHICQTGGGGGCRSGLTKTGEEFKDGDEPDTCSQCLPEDATACQNSGGTFDWASCNCNPTNPNTPIVIDVAGNGFDLTNAANGVSFDIRANGIPIQLAWTSPDSDDA